MNTLNSMKQRVLVLLAIIIMTTVTAVPAFAQRTTTIDAERRVGTAMVAQPKLETLRMRVVEEKTATGELRYTPADDSAKQASPRYPSWYYTCYFEGVQIPCSFLSWLWD